VTLWTGNAFSLKDEGSGVPAKELTGCLPNRQYFGSLPRLSSGAALATGRAVLVVPVPFFGSGGHNVAEINEIEQKVIDIVAEQMGVDKAEITRDTSFINDLNADSLDTVELVMEFEDEFEMSIPDEEAEKIQTVGQAIDYIKSVADKQGPKE
jgi:acyl carrier protein